MIHHRLTLSTYLMVSSLMLYSCHRSQVSDLELLKSSVTTYDASALDNLEDVKDEKYPKLGKDANHAIVPLIFKPNGSLYTIAEVNSSAHNPEKSINIFVSMADYQQFITRYVNRGEAFSEKVPYADARYAKPFGDSNFTFYIFDAFQKKYER